MKLFALKFAVVGAISVALVGCSVSRYHPKQLNLEAKGIATTESTPMKCKLMGTVEGNDGFDVQNQFGAVLPTKMQVRQGALNDLRNQAADVIGKSDKHIVLYVMSEQAICYGGENCTSTARDNSHIESYQVKAQIFDCGDKDK